MRRHGAKQSLACWGALLVMTISMGQVAAQKTAVNAVDCSKLRSVMSKLRSGGTIKVVTLGGSITTGYQAKPPEEKGWAAHVRRWFETKASESGGRVLFRNAGVSGTDSAFASVRAQDHVIEYGADIVILEFAVNDQWLDPKVRLRSFEGLVRRLSAGSKRSLVCLFLNEKGDARRGQGAEQRKIAEHYGLPWIAWAEGVAGRIASGEESWDGLFDGVETIHPNDRGHASIARLVVDFLEEVWDEAGAGSDLPSLDSSLASVLPEPLYGDDYQTARLVGSSDIVPIENAGWESGGDVHSEWRALGGEKQGWTTREPRAVISFRVKGKTIGITYSESDRYRNAEAWVELPDGSTTKKVSLECYVSYRKGYLGWAYREIASFPEAREVVLHVAVKKTRTTDDGKAANFTGIVLTGE